MLIIGEAIQGEFTVRNPVTGAASNADSLPTGKLVVDDVDQTATVTIANKATGLYSYVIAEAATTGFTTGQRGQVRINATVASVTDNSDVLDDTFGLNNAAYFAAMSLALGGQVNVSSALVDGDLTLYDNAGATRVFTNDGSSEWPTSLAAGHYETIEFHATIGSTTLKIGTGSVVVPTAPGQQVQVVFTREEVAELAALYSAAFPAANVLTQLANEVAKYAVYAFMADCSDNRTLAKGALIIDLTPFDSAGSVCPLSGT